MTKFLVLNFLAKHQIFNGLDTWLAGAAKNNRSIVKYYLDESHIKRDYKAICYTTNFYMSHLQYLELDIEFVSKMIDLFSELPYPYTLRDRIKNELWEKDDFKNNFEAIAEHNGIVIPDTFLK